MKKSDDSNVDRGWAWIIFLAAFTNFFLCGILYCAGIYNVKFLEMYDESRGTTAWSGALQLGLFSLAAPVGSFCNNLMGPRLTIALGASLTTSGFILTFFANSYIHVVVSYGICVGLGFCLSYYSSLVMIGFYFDKYRNAAYGFSLTGIGFGIIMFPILLEYLFNHYGVHGCMLIMGAIQSHMFIVAALTRPFHRTNVHHMKDSIDENKTKEIASSNDLKLPAVNIDKVEEKLLVNGNSHRSLDSEKLDAVTNKQCNIGPKKQIKSDETSPKICENSSLKNIHLIRSRNGKEIFQPQQKMWCHRYSDLFNISFAAYLICLLHQGIGLYSMYVHFPAYADSIGVSQNYNSILMSAMGAGSLACRIVAGIVTNGSKSRTLVVFISSSYFTGFACILGPYMCSEYIGQMIFALCFSFFGNIYIALMSPVVIDLTGLHRSVLTTGIALFFIGAGVVGGPPFIGIVADVTETYFYTFPLIGTCYLIGGLVMLVIPIRRRYAHHKEIPMLHTETLTIKVDA